jgi:hypothetical protein
MLKYMDTIVPVSSPQASARTGFKHIIIISSGQRRATAGGRVAGQFLI